MAELARGNVSDRPWGRTLGALGMRGLTGQLAVNDGKQTFRVAFDEGAIVAAHSPLASDAAVRIALTASLVSSTQVSEIARRQAAAPQRDELEVLAELARLSPDQITRLRRRTIAQRAARTFAVDKGEFVVVDTFDLPIVEGSALDVRAVIYLGAKQMLSDARLGVELGQMGTWFRLRSEAAEDLPYFGFGEPELKVVGALRDGAGEHELLHTGVDQRVIRAVLYALVSCNAATGEQGPPTAVQRSQAPAKPRDAADAPTDRRHVEVDAPTTVRRSPAQAASVDAPTAVARKVPSNRVVDPAHAAEAQALIESRVKLLDQGTDHFALIGVSRDATKDQIRTTYLALAKQLHPDRLASLGIVDDNRRAQRLMAEINTAFAVLSDPARRKEYQDVLSRGGAAAIRAEQERAEEMAHKVLESEEAFRRGEQALKRDQISTALRELERAIELNPDEPDYHAALAWARFCSATDKLQAAPAARQALDRAVRSSPKAVMPKFYLARVERIVGRDQDALRLFREVLEQNPRHAEATSEIRVLEARLSSDKGRKR